MSHQHPDIPRCRGLRPGMPCPVPDDCDCKRMDAEMDAAVRRMTNRDDRAFLYIAAALAVAIIVSFTAVWKALGADNSPPCLTKQAARAKYPGKYLYWHTADHCWDATSGTKHSPYRVAPKPTRKPSNEPDGSIAPKSPPGETVAYPTLMAGGGTSNTMLQPDAMTRWPLVMDFDEPPPQFKTWNDRIQFEEKK